MARVLALTWDVLPTLARYYNFPRTIRASCIFKAGFAARSIHGGRCAIRLSISSSPILDQSPVLELLKRSDFDRSEARAGFAGSRIMRFLAVLGFPVPATGVRQLSVPSAGFAHQHRRRLPDGGVSGAVSCPGWNSRRPIPFAPRHSTMTRTMSYAFG